MIAAQRTGACLTNENSKSGFHCHTPNPKIATNTASRINIGATCCTAPCAFQRRVWSKEESRRSTKNAISAVAKRNGMGKFGRIRLYVSSGTPAKTIANSRTRSATRTGEPTWLPAGLFDGSESRERSTGPHRFRGWRRGICECQSLRRVSSRILRVIGEF
jgi:hypothetical protein